MGIYGYMKILFKGLKEPVKNWGLVKNGARLCGIAALAFILGRVMIGYGLFDSWGYVAVSNTEEDYIKWMQFDVPLDLMVKAYEYDINSYNTEIELNWIELIAYSTAKNWGNFDSSNLKSMDAAAERLLNGASMAEITEGMELYPYYLECYKAVLSGYLGEFEVTEKDPDHPENEITVKKYGLKAFSPVAEGYYFHHYRDFGNVRTYGYNRKHMGNDLLGSVGTPIIAMEDGYVEALGWNQYGGWRIGIRSLDNKRYYYYAHLQKDHPFHQALEEGARVQAGDVIGYLGMTGYSAKENVNNIKTPHLHLGLQIIFDESQKDGVNQIWVDVYTLVEFLSRNKMPVYSDPATGDFYSAKKINTIPID